MRGLCQQNTEKRRRKHAVCTPYQHAHELTQLDSLDLPCLQYHTYGTCSSYYQQCQYSDESSQYRVVIHLVFNHKGLESKINITFLSLLDKKAKQVHLQARHFFSSWVKRGVLLEPSLSTPPHVPMQKTRHIQLYTIFMTIYHYQIIMQYNRSLSYMVPTVHDSPIELLQTSQQLPYMSDSTSSQYNKHVTRCLNDSYSQIG